MRAGSVVAPWRGRRREGSTYWRRLHRSEWNHRRWGTQVRRRHLVGRSASVIRFLFFSPLQASRFRVQIPLCKHGEKERVDYFIQVTAMSQAQTDTHTHRQTDRQTHTHRQTDTQTHTRAEPQPPVAFLAGIVSVWIVSVGNQSINRLINQSIDWCDVRELRLRAGAGRRDRFEIC